MILYHPKLYTGLPRASLEYEIRLISAEVFIFLYELDAPSSRSLTNDMENVIYDLKSSIPGICNAIIFYRDLEGIFDLVECCRYETAGITIYGALSEEEAVDMWLEKHKNGNFRQE